MHPVRTLIEPNRNNSSHSSFFTWNFQITIRAIAVMGIKKLVYLMPIAMPAAIALITHQRVSFNSLPCHSVYSIATPKKESAISVYAQDAKSNKDGMEIINIKVHQAVRSPQTRRDQSHNRIPIAIAHAKWICCAEISEFNPTPKTYTPSAKLGNQY